MEETQIKINGKNNQVLELADQNETKKLEISKFKRAVSSASCPIDILDATFSQKKINSPDIPQKTTQIYQNYDYLKIPPDWNKAKMHAKARETKPEKKKENQNEEQQQVCQCCGYEFERESINMKIDSNELGFLGCGYPLFFNYLKYCIIMLFVFFIIQGIPSIVFNSQGDFCKTSLQEIYEEEQKHKENKDSHFIMPCPFNLVVKYSMANQLNNDKQQYFVYISMGAVIAQIILTILFRRKQKQITAKIDEQNVTPADFTIFVSNIPTELKDPKETLKNLFEDQRTQEQEINVKKIVLIYNIEEIERIEHKINYLVKKKQNKLKKDGFNLENEQILNINEQIKGWEKELEHVEHKITSSNEYFAGSAFISFKSEQEKQFILEQNKGNTFRKFIHIFTKGKSKKYCSSIYINERHLHIIQASEPNDVDWEFIHFPKIQHIKARIIGFIKQGILIIMSYSIIAGISYFQANLIHHAYEHSLESGNDLSEDIQIKQAQCLTYTISVILIIFNKFLLPKLVHMIVDKEKWPTKTDLNISYATKLSICLFSNTALITFFVEIMLFNNYYGIGGGMIYSEYLVFILNSVVPALTWLIDPWGIIKNYQRKKELKKGEKSTLTQQEANLLMEFPDYSIGKRYADVMKTMWFTFFYSPIIPMGTLFSLFGIIFYYFVDKYNIIYRRTVKENIGNQLTIKMIELLEYCTVFHIFGSLISEYQLHNTLNKINLGTLVVVFIISQLPMQDINDWIFSIKSQDEETLYDEAVIQFDTDYDRENPALKKKAIQKFYNLRSRNQTIQKKKTQKEK